MEYQKFVRKDSFKFLVIKKFNFYRIHLRPRKKEGGQKKEIKSKLFKISIKEIRKKINNKIFIQH
jgi:hypothetical protein